ncbi:type I-B CRISPR-associated protein Cas8b1/Cst1 [Clostridium paridis]|uniref:Type I-B CRISPR-associated protein Cas8b1/Cst1 n=1 Tax=Clostridium paridis TaxID=2803863 RepID=A0A937FH66_9CLOT|nr:type I-B CRISPR-associated protein Cas8b1/Cst1 [Clostridium paridis]MBL4931897.1 type I-B CRISPR-associated protein Cas8b1/Cst1 [Clostridium paridis]
MDNTIRLTLEDWMFNAGIVGMYNILDYAGDKVVVEENYIEITKESLQGFEEKYFKYFIDTYLQTLSWYKIVSFKATIEHYEENKFENFTMESLEKLNNYITNIVKYYLKSASYKAAYDLIGGEEDMLSLEKKLTTIKVNKKETLVAKMEEVREVFKTLKIIINYFLEDKAKKYLAGKNVVYTIVKNAWNGVSFLFNQTKEKDMYIDYKNYFVTPVNEYLEADKSKYKYNCFICDNEIKDLSNDFSFLNVTGFDVARKSSHVWNFSNDVAICNVCKLVYSCIPAGMIYANSKGMFINANSKAKDLINVNNNIKAVVLQKDGREQSLTYKALITSIQKEFNSSFRYELADIQVIRYENEKYKFNILSRNILNVILKSKDELNKLMNCGFMEIKTYFNIYDLVIDSLLGNQNLFVLIHKLVVYKNSNVKDCRYSGRDLLSMLRINYNFIKEIGYMENIQEGKDIIDRASGAGYWLRQAYKSKKSEDKLNGISYRLLNALKTNNTSMFMDTLLNCYLYTRKEVPSVFLETLKDDLVFKHIGYAFVTSLIEGKIDENGGKNDGK